MPHKNEKHDRVARPRARGFPRAPSAFGCKAMFSPEQRATVLCKHTTCKEITDRDRLRDQQPVHLQEKEETNREASNFYLKSCSAHWVHFSNVHLLWQCLQLEKNE